jgi:hypothetical protein
VATRRDLDALGASLRGETIDVRAGLSELRGEIGGLRGELQAEFGALRGELGGVRGEVAHVRGELLDRIAQQTRSLVVAMIGTNAGLATLVLAAVTLT